MYQSQYFTPLYVITIDVYIREIEKIDLHLIGGDTADIAEVKCSDLLLRITDAATYLCLVVTSIFKDFMINKDEGTLLIYKDSFEYIRLCIDIINGICPPD